MKKIIFLIMVLFPILLFSQTKNIVPRNDGEGQLGTLLKAWGKVHADSIFLGGTSLHTLLATLFDANDFDTRFTQTSFSQIKEVFDYEPVIADSSILLYNSGVWQVWDLGIALQSLVAGTPTLPDSIIYTSELTSGLASKQNTLVSGTNIKTINSTSLLGSGNIDVVATLPDSVIFTSEITGDTSTHDVAQIDSAITSLEGGTTGQVLTKNSATNFDASWQTPSASGDTTHYVAFNHVLGLQDSIDALQSSITSILNEGDVRVPFVWEYLQLDTTGSVTSIIDSTGITRSTLTASKIFGVSTNDVVRIAVDSAQYRVKHNRTGSPTWSSWTGTAGYYKDVDSAQVRHYSSASYSTLTRQRFYVSADVDTFDVTTESSGGFTPASLSPVLYLVHDAGVTKDANNKVTSWTDGTYDFTMADTSITPLQTDSSIYFQGWGTFRRLTLADAGGNPFDIGTGDMSIEIWVWGTGGTGKVFEKDDIWDMKLLDADGVKAQFYAHEESYTNEAQVNTTISPVGGWHHLIFSWDRNGSRILFQDSVAIYATDVDFTDLQSVDLNGTASTTIGGTVFGGLGHIAVIRFYNYALNPTQVKQLYEYGKE